MRTIGISSQMRKAFLENFTQRLKQRGFGVYSPASLVMIQRGLNVLDLYLHGEEEELAHWSIDDLRRYQDYLREEYRPATAALYGEFVLGHFLKFARFRGMVDSNLPTEVETTYRTRTHNNTQLGLPDEPLEAMIQTVEMYDALGVRNRVILELLLKTGPKVYELIGVALRDVDVQHEHITYRGKGAPRAVSLDPILLDLLPRYIRTWRAQLIPEEESDRLLLSRTGRPLDRSNVWRIVKKQFADLDESCPKELRNEFVRRLLEEGKPRGIVRELAGYSQMAQTYVYMPGVDRGTVNRW